MNDYQRIERALELLEHSASRDTSLEAIAAVCELSPSYFQRLFTRWAGVSPKRFLQSLTVAHARALLDESRPVLDVAFEAGLSGAGRLHDLTVSIEAMTPGEIKRRGEGLVIRAGVIDSPFGEAMVAFTERGLCALEFMAADAEATTRARLCEAWPRAQWIETSADERARWQEQIFGTAMSSVGRAPIRILTRGTNFQVQVWRALLRVPEGCVIDYGDLARRLGNPGAARAVGTAVGANPVALLIPCHRVLRKHGELGGYRWGTARKLAVLGREWTGRSAGAA